MGITETNTDLFPGCWPEHGKCNQHAPGARPNAMDTISTFLVARRQFRFPGGEGSLGDETRVGLADATLRRGRVVRKTVGMSGDSFGSKKVG